MGFRAVILIGRAVGAGVDYYLGQELAYVKAAAVGDKISERSEPPSSYPWEDRRWGGIRLPDWYEQQLRHMRNVSAWLDEYAGRDIEIARQQMHDDDQAQGIEQDGQEDSPS